MTPDEPHLIRAGRRHAPPTALLILGLILVALNLRPTLAGFGPLLSQIQQELRVNATTVSLLTTIPLVCFGAFAPVAPWLTRARSSETVILGCLGLIMVGALFRVGPALPWILLGTLLVGAGIAVVNVLLPGWIRVRFPAQAGVMMGVYTFSVVGGAALASGLSIPLRNALGGAWRPSLGVWAALALLGVVAWLPTVLGRPPRASGPSLAAPSVWQNPAALWVTLYMGFQSLVFYAWLTWLPKVLQDHGSTLAASGTLLALGNLVQLPFTLAVPIWASRRADQRGLVLGTSLLVAAGLLGLLLFPASAPLPWVLLLGAGCGGTFSLALVLIVQRAQTPSQVPQLSALAQGAGYLLAASGPFVFGAVHDHTGQWTAPLWFLVICTVLVFLVGLRAGKPLDASRA
ncbi:CynX/NimT family MFS transporter [Deinococcus sp. UYEF24]